MALLNKTKQQIQVKISRAAITPCRFEGELRSLPSECGWFGKRGIYPSTA